MSKIVYPDKSVGDKFKATEATEIKVSVNALYDQFGNLALGDLKQVVPVTIAPGAEIPAATANSESFDSGYGIAGE
jgi:hypothetical protein